MNVPSLTMFQSKLGFAVDKLEPDFEETHLKMRVTPETVDALRTAAPAYTVETFTHPAS